MSASRRLLSRFVVATFVVFLHLSSEISSFQKVRNRFFRQWDTQDAIALTLDILLLGLLVTAAVQLLDRPRWPRVGRALRALFVLGLITGVVDNIEPLHRPHFLFFEVMWMMIGALVGYVFARPGRLVPLAYRGALLFSPLVLIVIGQMFTWSTWSSAATPLRISHPTGPARPVFVFVFDEWSFARSAPGGEFPAEYPNLRALAGQSLTFRAARSPGDDTYRALPLLIFGERPLTELPRVFAKEGKEGREYVTGPHPARPVEGIFETARAAGYNTAMIGFYLPYPRMFPDSVDFVRGYSYYPTARSLWSRMVLHAIETLRWETDPISRKWFRKRYAEEVSEYWLRLRDDLQGAIDVAIDRMPGNTVAFVHYPLPHAPFVFNADGSFRGPYPVHDDLKNEDEDRMAGTVEDYRRQLGYLDHMVGNLIERLRRAGKYDDALIVMTSDHSWRQDPDPRLRTAGRRSVPLLIKLPGQRNGCVVDQPFSNARYLGFVRNALLGDSRDPGVDSLIARCRPRP